MSLEYHPLSRNLRSTKASLWTSPNSLKRLLTCSEQLEEEKFEPSKRWAHSLDKQYDIKRWYAIPVTPEGEKLVQHLEFEKIEGKRKAYVLTDFKRATKPIRSFIDVLGKVGK